MHKLLRSAAFAALLVAAPAQETSPAPIELRWHGKVGDVLRLRTTMSQTVEFSMMPQGMETESSFVLRQEVRQVSPEGVGSLDVEYEAIRIDIEGPLSLSYDSTLAGEAAKQNSPELAAMCEPMLAASFHMTIEPSGQVLEITGLKEALDRTFDQLKTPGMGEMFKQLFSEDSLRRMVEVNTFPAQPLSAGDTWPRVLEVQAPRLGTLKLAFENELQGVEKRGDQECARIAISGSAGIESRDEDSPIPMKVSMDDSDIAGTMFIALDSGYLIESSLTTSMDLLMSFGENAGEEQEQEEGGMEMKLSLVTKQQTVRIGADAPFFE